MTVREELIREIEQASDDILQVLLNFLRQTQLTTPNLSLLRELAEIPSSGNAIPKHYPLRGIPLAIAEDFDAPLSDLWDALGE